MKKLKQANAFDYLVIVLAAAITIFYVYVMITSLNPQNVLASTPDIIHVSGAIGVLLIIHSTPNGSLMKLLFLVTMLFLTNLG